MFTESSLQEVVNTLTEFEANSGLKLNYDKSSVCRIGSLHKSKAILCISRTLNWMDEKINLSGVDMGDNIIVKNNYSGMVDKIKDILHTWRYRGLSLLVKILMLNALVGSLFVYKLNVVPLTDDEERAEINQGLNQYLWNGAKPKVDILTLSRKKEQGRA